MGQAHGQLSLLQRLQASDHQIGPVRLRGTLPPGGYMTNSTDHYLDHAGFRRNTESHDPIEFSYVQIQDATNDFHSSRILGVGGFGVVYRGRLSSGQQIAVKQLDRTNNCQQGEVEFLNEIVVLSTLNHPNVVNLRGYCSEDDHRLIVYEYMDRGSLDRVMYDVESSWYRVMSWFQRTRIALGVARGLYYLHHVATPPVIVRDLKLSNILLSTLFYAKISDFGLSKFGPTGGFVSDSEHQLQQSRQVGTEGYWAPECACTGILTAEADVFSFGVILLELLTEKPPILISTRAQWSKKYLAGWACERYDVFGELERMALERVRRSTPVNLLRLTVRLAIRCVRVKRELRPNMQQVVTALEAIARDDIGRNEGMDRFGWLFEEVVDDDPAKYLKETSTEEAVAQDDGGAASSDPPVLPQPSPALISGRRRRDEEDDDKSATKEEEKKHIRRGSW